MGFLNFTILVAVVFWIGDLKFRGGENVTDLWYRVSAPIRAESRLLPPIVAGVVWFILFVISGYTASPWDAFVIFLIVPMLMAWQMMKMGAPFGWVQAMIDGISHGFGSVGSGETNDNDDFQLPMNVYESEADDVGTWFSDSVPIPRRTLGLIGSSGAGKTNTVKHLLNQIDIRNTRTVVYDHKSDYEELCADRGIPFVKISGKSGSDDVVWNVFREMETEEDADEIARALFPEPEGEDSHFDDRARQVFAAVLKYLQREMKNPTNADLVRYSNEADKERIYEDLGEYDDFNSVRSALNPDNSSHAESVHTTYDRIVSDIFVGSFAEAGEFSIREYMANPEKYGVLLFSLPRKRQETVAPLFSHLLDRCVNEGMNRPEECIYLLDEIEFLPSQMGRLQELVSVGRGEKCQAIITLQSVSQFYDRYGTHGAKGIMASFRSVVLLRLGEDESKEYAKDVVGHHVEEYTGHVDKTSLPNGGSVETGRETRLQEEPDFRGDYGKFSKGECVVARQGSGYVYGYVPEFVQ